MESQIDQILGQYFYRLTGSVLRCPSAKLGRNMKFRYDVHKLLSCRERTQEEEGPPRSQGIGISGRAFLNSLTF